MATVIEVGADVGSGDESFGAVERVVKDERTGEVTAVIVRHGRADYLVRVRLFSFVRAAGEQCDQNAYGSSVAASAAGAGASSAAAGASSTSSWTDGPSALVTSSSGSDRTVTPDGSLRSRTWIASSIAA